jgi:GMP synthase-like glutamine amidotransferase
MNDVLVARNIPHEGAGLFEQIFIAERIGYDIVELGRESGLPSPRNYKAVLIFGGLDSANDTTIKVTQQQTQIKLALKYDIPFLGVCLGHQILAKAAGGLVAKCKQKEVGFIDPNGEPYTVALTATGRKSTLLTDIPDVFTVFELHSEEVQKLSSNIQLLAKGKHAKHQIIQVKGHRAYGLQAHLELTPAMLAQWADEEPYLNPSDKNKLLAELEALQPTYDHIGRTLARNFLKIANLIQ